MSVRAPPATRKSCRAGNGPVAEFVRRRHGSQALEPPTVDRLRRGLRRRQHRRDRHPSEGPRGSGEHALSESGFRPPRDRIRRERIRRRERREIPHDVAAARHSGPERPDLPRLRSRPRGRLGSRIHLRTPRARSAATEDPHVGERRKAGRQGRRRGHRQPLVSLIEDRDEDGRPGTEAAMRTSTALDHGFDERKR